MDQGGGTVHVSRPVVVGHAALPSEAHCPVCATKLDGELVECSRCGTLHHRECWDYLGDCAIFGCAPVRNREERSMVVGTLRKEISRLLELSKGVVFLFVGSAVGGGILYTGLVILVSMPTVVTQHDWWTFALIVTLGLTICFWGGWVLLSLWFHRARRRIEARLVRRGVSSVKTGLSRGLEERSDVEAFVSRFGYGATCLWTLLALRVGSWLFEILPGMNHAYEIEFILVLIGVPFGLFTLMVFGSIWGIRCHLKGRQVLQNHQFWLESALSKD